LAKWLRTQLLVAVFLFLLLVSLLLTLDWFSYNLTLPMKITIHQRTGSLFVDNQTIPLGNTGQISTLLFADRDPVLHEYQIDGSDSTNNFTQDSSYLHTLSTSFYYHFQAWMRNLDSLSHWRDVSFSSDGKLYSGPAWPAHGSKISLPADAHLLTIQLSLQRPETPATLILTSTSGLATLITIDRNNHQITVAHQWFGLDTTGNPEKFFFPLNPLPFLGMLADTLIRTLLWSLFLLCTLFLLEIALLPFHIAYQRLSPHSTTYIKASPFSHLQALYAHLTKLSLARSLHPIALLALILSLIFTCWIALVQYRAEPHIYDASAYLFAAKMYALGRLSVPVPSTIAHFPGPFMLAYKGQWFAQYAPGTSLTLVPGIWLGTPWLVEPLLGTLALLGIGLIAARLFNRQVATLAVLLGTLSPFYSYLAASYLSHTIALFYLVWGLWCLLRFVQDAADNKYIILSALAFGMASLTRDLVAVLYVAIFIPGVLLLVWPQIRAHLRYWLMPISLFFAILLLFLCLSLLFNFLLTGHPLLTPRELFFPGDRWGFGPNIGFGGQHTLAAGLVNLDELLTILAIDLFGWPFYLTFAFLPLPFLLRRALKADWILLAWLVIGTTAYIGYFYHGIYLGPRYLFETLPFWLILTARGILSLNSWVSQNTSALLHALRFPLPKFRLSLATLLLLSTLLLCNLLYFLPRQIDLHRNYTGLPNGYLVDTNTLYHPPMHNAIIVTSDYTIYQFILFPLNDPLLHGDLLYALASTPQDYTELRRAFPKRALYALEISTDGSIHYKFVAINSAVR
jgi:Dolichyl-phosphate-mannose-protein mannosyltransferase